jgi:hypothetical protein
MTLFSNDISSTTSRFSAFLLFICLSASVQAKGVTPYLPLNMSPEIERQIERLMAIAGDPILTRPIPAARALAATEKACAKASLLCKQVKTYLRRYMKPDGFAYFNLEASLKSDEASPLANKRGQESDNAATINAQLYRQLGSYVGVALGGEYREDGENMDGTYSSYGADWLQLDVGYRPRWLSPMQSSAMLWSTNAETPFTVGISNYQPLTDLNIRYDVFAGQLSKSDKIAFDGGLTSGEPCVVGMHLSLEPVPGVSFGANRIMQFGGGDRGKCYELDNFVEALFDPKSADNFGAEKNSDDEFGNQLASITGRFNARGPFPWSAYFEYGGEDTSLGKAYRFGNQALQAGLYLPSIHDDYDLTIEFAEWQNGWYVNGLYGDGLRNDGNVLGHWAGDRRLDGAGIGGRSIMAASSWQIKANQLMYVELRQLKQQDYGGFNYEVGHDISMRYSIGLDDYLVGVQGMLGKTVFGENFYQAGVFTRW